jgi:hypothetical protein
MNDNNGRSFRDELNQLPPDLELGTTAADIMRRGRRRRTAKQGFVAGTAALAVVGIAALASNIGGGSSGTVQSAGGNGLGAGLAVPVSSPAPASSLAHTSTSVASGSPVPGAVLSASAIPESPAPVASASPLSPVSSTSTSSSTTTSCAPAPQSTVGAPTEPSDTNDVPWGTVIPVGTDTSGKSVVIYGFTVAEPAIPCTHVGFMLGTKDATGVGGVTGLLANNESSGSDLAPGFHADGLYGGGNQINNWYVMGYYVGDAASITIPEKAQGADLVAKVVPWSVNPNIKVWWVGGSGAVPTDYAFGAPSAKDAQGNTLPVGKASAPAVG